MVYGLESRTRLPAVNRRADDVAGYHQLHAAIRLTAGGGGVVGYRHRLAEATRDQDVRVHTLFNQKLTHGIGALVREPHVVLVSADAIGMAFDLQSQARVAENDAGDARQFLPRARAQGEA